ncbi:hypothetical protein Tco_0463761, partial [Tanacetum coccineum]
DNSQGSGTDGRRQVPTQRECTHTDFLNFLKCQPINFKGTEGVVSLTQWVEKMESVFLISNYAITSQVKYASCTPLRDCLDVVELARKGCRTRCCIYDAMDGLKKDNNR